MSHSLLEEEALSRRRKDSRAERARRDKEERQTYKRPDRERGASPCLREETLRRVLESPSEREINTPATLAVETQKEKEVAICFRQTRPAWLSKRTRDQE